MRGLHLRRVAAVFVVAGTLLATGCGTKSTPTGKSTTTTTVADNAGGPGSHSGRTTESTDASNTDQGDSGAGTGKLADGLTLVAATPKGVKDPANWGGEIASARTKEGGILVVFTHENLNNDDTTGDDELLWTVSDPKTHTWSKPASIAKGTFEANGGGPSIAVAVNAATGQWAVASTKESSDATASGIDLYWSSDKGSTWNHGAVVRGSDDASPSVAYGTKTLAVTYVDDDGPKLATATAPTAGATTLGAFSSIALPPLAGVDPDKLPAAVTVGADDKPVVVYNATSSDDSTVHLALWKQGGQPTELFNSKGNSNDHAALTITGTGVHLVVATAITTTDKDDEPVVRVFTSSDNGATWSTPIPLKNDDAGDPFSLTAAVTGQGRAAVTYFPNTSGGGNTCPDPKVAVSDDLTSWQPCLDLKLIDAGGFATNHYPSVSAASDNELVAVFASTGSIKQVPDGLLAWTLPTS